VEVIALVRRPTILKAALLVLNALLGGSRRSFKKVAAVRRNDREFPLVIRRAKDFSFTVLTASIGAKSVRSQVFAHMMKDYREMPPHRRGLIWALGALALSPPIHGCLLSKCRPENSASIQRKKPFLRSLS